MVTYLSCFLFFFVLCLAGHKDVVHAMPQGHKNKRKKGVKKRNEKYAKIKQTMKEKKRQKHAGEKRGNEGQNGKGPANFAGESCLPNNSLY